MSTPNEEHRGSPADRFRNIISADEKKEGGAIAPRRYPKSTHTPSLNLPQPLPPETRPVQTTVVDVKAEPIPRQPEQKEPNRLMPAFWTTASIISLLFNIAMVVLVVVILRNMRSLNASGLGTGVLGGLYSNFELMDAAHIKTSIPVQANIPLDLSVPVQTTTAISLAHAVTIPGAHVRITTPALNIDAPASVTLPAGTSLDVDLNFALPVQGQVPVSMNVPVDIAVHDTELHPSIQGLQDTIRPLYCMVAPSAQTLSGDAVCK
ncbi:MAG TPA: hypothetical protein VMJ64_18330 [Anaerolineales bacterium]|nr:hypothetical protein [Anaerolineales bacterium]